MSLFIVDEEKCKRDGLCAAVCPYGLIEMRSDESFPSPTEDAEEVCINCGHCVAICPHAALSLKTMKPEECPSVRKELLLNPEHAEHFLRYRRSIRTYKEKPVDTDTLAKLIDMARYAPSGHNLQPVHWLVLGNQDGQLRRLGELVADWMRATIVEKPEMAGPLHLERVVKNWERGEDHILRGAPHLIVAHAHPAAIGAQVACVIALSYLELAATTLGLGACWAGYFNTTATFYPPMMKALALPEGHKSFGAMMVGYQKYAYHRLPLRNEPKIVWR